MGLLDYNFDDPKTLGLLNAGLAMLGASGATRSPVNFGQILQGGLQAYTGTLDDHRKRLQQEEEAKQIAAMRNIQLQEHQNAMAEREARRQQAAHVQGLVQKFGNDYAGMVRAGVPYDTVKQLAESQTLGLPEVARTIETEGDDGGKLISQVDKFGRIVASPLAGYTPAQLVDMGGKSQFVKPRTGAEFTKTLSPAEIAANQRAQAQLAQSERHYQGNLALKREELLKGQPAKPMTAAQEAKYREQIANDYKALTSAINTMNEVAKSSENLATNPEGVKGITGIQSYFPSIPNSKAAKADVGLQNLKGKITQLGKVAASAGGAIGAIANQEWRIMSDMIAAIDPAKGDEPMKQQISELNSYAEGAARRMADAYEKQYSVDFDKYPQFQVPKINTQGMAAKPTMRFNPATGKLEKVQ